MSYQPKDHYWNPEDEDTNQQEAPIPGKPAEESDTNLN